MENTIYKNINNLGKIIEPLFDSNKLHRYPTPNLPFSSFSIELDKSDGDYDGHFGYSSEILSFENNYSDTEPKCRVSIKIHEPIGKKFAFNDTKVLFETDDFNFLETFIKLISQK